MHQTKPEPVWTSLKSFLTEYSNLIDTATLPWIKVFKAHFHIKPNSNFKLFKPWPVPYALGLKVEAELDRLKSLGIINKVETSEFSTTSIVPVLMQTGKVRICGHFKVSVEQYLEFTQYSLLHIEEVFKRLFRDRVLQARFIWCERSGWARQRIKASCDHHYAPRFIPVQSFLL